MTPPDLMTKTEERQLAEMIETNVDFWQESRGLHEAVHDDEGEE